MHHVETAHPEDGQSPFLAVEENSYHAGPGMGEPTKQPATNGLEYGGSDLVLQGDDSSAGTCYIECPTGCGELISYSEFPVHLDFHFAESAVLEETGCQDLATEHVKKKWDEYMADADRQVAMSLERETEHDMERDLALDQEVYGFDVTLKGSRKASRGAPSSHRRQKDQKSTKGAAHGSSSRGPRRGSVCNCPVLVP
jgi:hypothetical protein